MKEKAKQRALAQLDERAKDAIKRLAEPIAELSQIAHEQLDITKADEDDDYVDFDRVHWLGTLADALPGLCGPHLRVIAQVLDTLPLEHEEKEAMH